MVVSMPDLSWASGTEKTFEHAQFAFAVAWASLQNTLEVWHLPPDRSGPRH
jgi:hypothetical protein